MGVRRYERAIGERSQRVVCQTPSVRTWVAYELGLLQQSLRVRRGLGAAAQRGWNDRRRVWDVRKAHWKQTLVGGERETLSRGSALNETRGKYGDNDIIPTEIERPLPETTAMSGIRTLPIKSGYIYARLYTGRTQTLYTQGVQNKYTERPKHFDDDKAFSNFQLY